MRRLTSEQRDLIYELLDCSHDKHITQFLLNAIGENNWTRDTLSCARYQCLTQSQLALFHSMGGHYDADEATEHLFQRRIERAVVSPYDEFDVEPGDHSIVCKLKLYHLSSMLSQCDLVLGHEFKQQP